MTLSLSTSTPSTPTADAQTSAVQQKSGKKTVVMPAPFSRSGKRHVEAGNSYQILFGGRKNTSLPSFGHMRGGKLKIALTGGSGTATVALQPDAPWSLVKSFILRDANSQPIITADGYMMKLIRKYGGYRRFKPESSPAFTALATGANGTGNGQFLVEWFNEFGRDGLGCLPNDQANSLYKYELDVDVAANVYSTPPTNVPTITVEEFVDCRGVPDSVDIFGNPQSELPPSAGTTQYWTSEQFDVTSGKNKFQLKEVGNMVRNHFLIWRSSTDGTRATAVSDGTMPTQLSAHWDKGDIFVNYDVDLLHDNASKIYEMNVATEDPGVILLPYFQDAADPQLEEYGDYWLPTVAQSKFVYEFTSTHAGTLQVCTNYFVPGDGDIWAAPMMEING